MHIRGERLRPGRTRRTAARVLLTIPAAFALALGGLVLSSGEASATSGVTNVAACFGTFLTGGLCEGGTTGDAGATPEFFSVFFTSPSALSSSDTIFVSGQSDTNFTGYDVFVVNESVEGGEECTTSESPPTDDGTLLEVPVPSACASSAGTSYSVIIDNSMTNPTTPGTYQVDVSTTENALEEASNDFTIESAPAAPTGVTATPTDGQATVNWTDVPDADDGGSAITGYTITAADSTTTANGGETCSPASLGDTSCIVTGLTDGDSYTFTATATNGVGTSSPSSASSPEIPDPVPSAPTGVSAVPGYESAVVSWIDPAPDAINSYTVTAADSTTPANGGQTCTAEGASATSCTATGLTEGDSYTFTVIASNDDGSSSPSVASAPVSPGPTAPGVPTGVTATPAAEQASVSWTDPPANGSDITYYTTTATDVTTPANGGETCPADSTDNPCTVTGLTDGDSYTFTVTATNGIGTSTPSDPSSPVTPATTPGQPTGVSATPGIGQATVNWSAPASDGGSDINGYTVTAADTTTPANGGETCAWTSGPLSCIVTGLTNGDGYTFTVTATNGAGTGSASDPSGPVTPQATAPDVPTGLSAVSSDGSVTLQWDTPDSDGGDAIMGYDVYMGINSGAESASPENGGTLITGTTDTISSLSDGTTYFFTVEAVNSIGNSAASNEASGTPAASGTSAVSDVTVDPGSLFGGAATSYSLSFTTNPNTGDDLTSGDTVTLLAPAGTTLSGVSSAYSIDDALVSTAVLSQTGGSSTDNEVVLTIPDTVDIAPGNVPTVVASDVVNPSSGTGSWEASTSVDTVPGESNSYTISGSVDYTAGCIDGVGDVSSDPSDEYSLVTEMADVATSGGVVALGSGCTYTFTAGAYQGGDSEVFALPAISGNVTIVGNGATISANGDGFAFFDVNPGAELTLSGVTLQYADQTSGGGNGGAILNDGTLSVDQVTFAGNYAGTDGGAIDNADDSGSTVTAIDSTFSSNNAEYGGAIETGYDGGSLTVIGSTFTSNGAELGGAIDNDDDTSGGTLSVTSSTFSQNESYNGGAIDNGDEFGLGLATIASSSFIGNYAFNDGGAIDNGNGVGEDFEGYICESSEDTECSFATITDSSFVENSANGDGAAIDNGDYDGNGIESIVASTFAGNEPNSGNATIDNFFFQDIGASILADATPESPECYGGATEDDGYNLESDDSCDLAALTSVTDDTNLVNEVPLGSLTSGSPGSPPTIPFTPNTPTDGILIPDSPPVVIDGIAVCPGVDETGATRPGGGNECDPGAVEYTATDSEAPTSVSATPSDTSATVSWTDPVSDGGSTISSYTVTAADSTTPANGGETCTATGESATSCVVTGLTNGDSYTFTVTATNDIGTSAPSVASTAVVPALAPEAPTIGTATGGNASATVNWTDPASDGGSTILNYTATAVDSTTPADGGETCTADGATATSCVVTGLTNGDSYTFTVVATNGVGPSLASAPSNAVVPALVPGAPTIGTVTPGTASATVNWTDPDSNGGSTILSYTATAADSTTPADGGETCTADGATATSCVVTGLTNGDSYTFTVVATNGVGPSLASAPSNAVVPALVAGAPTIGTVTPGTASATVNWTDPDSNGGSTILSYTATAADSTTPANGGQTCTVDGATATSCLVTGLTNGDSYTFTVVATNAIGASLASGASSAVVPALVPGAPTIGTVTPGTASATVNWTDPGSDGGSTILSYTATAADSTTPANGGETCTADGATATSCVVTGLTNGDSYTFTVVATNAIGPSLPSAASSAVVPALVPGAPTIGTVTPADASATVNWTDPASDGGSTTLSYTATAADSTTPANGGQTCSADGATATSCVVTGLTNGDSYTFTVVATNAIGASLASSASSAVVPDTFADAPTIGTATPSDTSATVNWTDPASDGGSTILNYTATATDSTTPANGGETCTADGATATSCVVTGLTNGDSYTFTVIATNGVGPSSASAASSAVVPATDPGAPTIGSATPGNASATVSWTDPASDDGSTILSYTVTATDSTTPANGGQTCTATGATQTSCTVNTLTNGDSYTFTVVATNAVGSSEASAASNSVTPVLPVVTTPTPPTPPAGVTVSDGGSSSSPTGTATATLPGNTLSASGAGVGAVTVGQYATDPVSSPTTFASSGTFLDVEVATGSSFSTLTITDCDLNGATSLEWWNGSAWAPVSPESAPTGSPACITATLTSASSPTIDELTGTVFAGVLSTAPGAPTGLAATPGDTTVTLNWAAPSSDGGATILGYNVFEGTAAGGESATPVNGASLVNGTSYSVNGLTDGTTYYFTVEAVNSAGSSTASNEVSATPATAHVSGTTGYWEVTAAGGVVSFGGATSYGSLTGTKLNSPIVGLAATPDGKGYWLVAADGGVFSFGDAAFYGSEGGHRLNSPIVGVAATPSGHGYWLVAADGGVFSFGDAAFYGSEGGHRLNSPVVGIAATPSGHGYWLVAADGGVFSFGDASFYGSEGGQKLNSPVVGMAASTSGNGYWLVAADGGVFSFGDASFYGSEGGTRLNTPIVGMAASTSGHGYWLVAADGGVFSFGDATFAGSDGGRPPSSPTVGLAVS
jgi:large repetitive protein